MIPSANEAAVRDVVLVAPTTADDVAKSIIATLTEKTTNIEENLLTIPPKNDSSDHGELNEAISETSDGPQRELSPSPVNGDQIVSSTTIPSLVENEVVASTSVPSILENTLVPPPANPPIAVKQIVASTTEPKIVIALETSDDSSSECSSCQENHSENNEESGIEEDEPEYEIEVRCTDENALISSVFGNDYQTGYQVASIKYNERELICRCGMEFICALKKTTNKHIVFLQILKASEKYDENLVVVMAQGREVRNWLKKTGKY